MKKNEYPLIFLSTELVDNPPFEKSKEVEIGKVTIVKPDWLHNGDMFIFAKKTGDKRAKFFHIGQAHEAHEEENLEDRS